MDLLVIIGIALGLSMDAFAVSITNGVIIKDLKFIQAFRIALSFGLFQAIMPVIGWLAGAGLVNYIKLFDHWIAFILLAFIGIKMIIESRKLEDSNEGECNTKNCTHFPTLMVLSLATSIDALAVGVSYGVLRVDIVIPIIIIGSLTFIICLAGIYIGKNFGHFFENKFELIGGIVLILIGLKIIVEHLVKSV